MNTFEVYSLTRHDHERIFYELVNDIELFFIVRAHIYTHEGFVGNICYPAIH